MRAMHEVGGQESEVGQSLHVVDMILCEVDGIPSANFTVRGKGTVDLRLDGNCAMMRRLFVDPVYRREGVGTALYQAARKLAMIRNKVSMAWTVNKTNKDAIRFYARQGAQIFFEEGDSYWMAETFREVSL